MPARSEAQRQFIYGVKGKEFAEEHHFDNKGKLPKRVKRRKDADEELADLINAIEPSYGNILVKGMAHAAELNLRVGGVTRHATGDLVYRMETRDGHYVGRTNPTKVRAKKGDILKVQANDFLQDRAGDAHWVNPNVVSHYTDSAHSWRELCAIAGGELEKEGAPGPAGDLPPSNDTGKPGMPSKQTLSSLSAAYWVGGSGPTLGDVHSDKPLPNISISYAGKKKKLEVKKADKARQLIYGVVLEPNSLDSQDDFMLPDQVEKAAHTYLTKVARGKATVSKLQHTTRGFFKEKPSVVPVESFIAPCDFSYDGKETVKKGTWVMVLKAEDENVWEDVLGGKYTGLSIGGTGIRRDATVPPEAAWLELTKTAEPKDFASFRDWQWEGAP